MSLEFIQIYFCSHRNQSAQPNSTVDNVSILVVTAYRFTNTSTSPVFTVNMINHVIIFLVLRHVLMSISEWDDHRITARYLWITGADRYRYIPMTNDVMPSTIGPMDIAMAEETYSALQQREYERKEDHNLPSFHDRIGYRTKFLPYTYWIRPFSRCCSFISFEGRTSTLRVGHLINFHQPQQRSEHVSWYIQAKLPIRLYKQVKPTNKIERTTITNLLSWYWGSPMVRTSLSAIFSVNTRWIIQQIRRDICFRWLKWQ